MQRSVVRLSLVLVSFASLSILSSCASGRVNLVRTAPPPGIFNRTQPILVGNFDVGERAKMLGLQMGGVGLGAMTGPALGGLLVGQVHVGRDR